MSQYRWIKTSLSPDQRKTLPLDSRMDIQPGRVDLVVERLQEINATPEQILKVIRSIEQWTKWDPNITKVIPETAGPLKVGDKFFYNPGGFKINTKVAEIGDRHIIWRGESRWGVGVRHFYLVAKDAHQTTVVLHEDFYGVWFRIFGWMTDFGIGKGMTRTLAGLVRRLAEDTKNI